MNCLLNLSNCFRCVTDIDRGVDLYHEGNRFILGEEGPIDREAAVRCYREGAERGDARCMGSLGVCLLNGTGVAQDNEEAFQWFLWGANLDDPLSLFMAGRCYFEGKVVREDPEKAFECFSLGAELEDPRCMHALGRCFEEGRGTAKNEETAVYWYRKGAYRIQESCFCYQYKAVDEYSADCMYALGRCYELGIGQEEDPFQAVYWYRRAAFFNHLEATRRLGDCFRRGYGVDFDPAEAIYWFKRGADLGDSQCCYKVALDHRLGPGVVRDLRLAFHWMFKATQSSPVFPPALYFLGRWYERGEGVVPDRAMAIHFYTQAAEMGQSDAQEALKQLGIG